MLDRDLEESQSERNTKYRELRKREETMDQVQGHNNMQNILSFSFLGTTSSKGFTSF